MNLPMMGLGEEGGILDMAYDLELKRESIMRDGSMIDYEREPICTGSPYYRCVHCKKTEYELMGRVDTHSEDCKYRLSKESMLNSDGFTLIELMVVLVMLSIGTLVGITVVHFIMKLW